MSDQQFRLKSGCSEKWAFAGAVEEIRRRHLVEVRPVECERCGFWHLRIVQARRAAA